MSSRVEYAPISKMAPSLSHQSAPASDPVPVATAVAYSCSVGGKTVNSHVFVPSKASELNKATVKEHVHNHARAEANASSHASVVCSHIKPLSDNVQAEAPAEDHYLASRMAPSCKQYNYDLNQVTSFNRYTCRYLGTGTVTDAHGNAHTVTANPFKEYTGILPSCDTFGMGPSGLEIKDETMKAIRHHAYIQAGGKESDLQEERFMCEVMSLPPY